jgi:hypothetical protein
MESQDPSQLVFGALPSQPTRHRRAQSQAPGINTASDMSKHRRMKSLNLESHLKFSPAYSPLTSHSITSSVLSPFGRNWFPPLPYEAEHRDSSQLNETYRPQMSMYSAASGDQPPGLDYHQNTFPDQHVSFQQPPQTAFQQPHVHQNSLNDFAYVAEKLSEYPRAMHSAAQIPNEYSATNMPNEYSGSSKQNGQYSHFVENYNAGDLASDYGTEQLGHQHDSQNFSRSLDVKIGYNAQTNEPYTPDMYNYQSPGYYTHQHNFKMPVAYPENSNMPDAQTMFNPSQYEQKLYANSNEENNLSDVEEVTDCQWVGCSLKFNNVDELVAHVTLEHIGVIHFNFRVARHLTFVNGTIAAAHSNHSPSVIKFRIT